MAQTAAVFIKIDTSTSERALSARIVKTIRAMEKADANLWADMAAVVRRFGLEALPEVPREARNAGNIASLLRRAVKLGVLSQLYKEDADGVAVIGKSAAELLLKEAAKKAANADTDNTDNTDDTDTDDTDAIDTAQAAKHAQEVLMSRLALMKEALETVARMGGKAGAVAKAALAAAAETN